MRLINISLPCIRDFRGVPTRLDGQGNYTLGLNDHTIFPEVSAEGTNETIGMDVCINTSALSDDEGRELLKLFGMPSARLAPKSPKLKPPFQRLLLNLLKNIDPWLKNQQSNAT